MMSVFFSNSLIHAPETQVFNLFRGGRPPDPPRSSRLQRSLKTPSTSFSISPPTSPFLIEHSDYPTSTIDEILPELSRAKVFSTVDAKNGFWHVELDDDSSCLPTFNSPFGRFRWLRLPFGLCTAPEETKP
mgnify:CR=1 FL=1